MDQVFECTNCGTRMKRVKTTDAFSYVCPFCGCFIEEKQNFDLGYLCPNCHSFLDDSTECTHCGYDLGSDFE